MKDLKCPKCGEIIKIDETDYESILKQVRDEDFYNELEEREKQFEKEKKTEIKLAEAEIKEELRKELEKKEAKIVELENKLELSKANSELAINKAITEKEQEITELKKDVEYYKDFKARLSTKMIGESLEVHCKNEFDSIRPLFQNVSFEKDNDSKSGSKGDFILRDFDEDGNEITSIMFEMKNEADETATKHKNEDFLKELDKDRREKKCEFAVLVSLLEADNDFYNQGIVDVSHIYEKTYVIRPQFFIPIITLIHNLSRKSLEYRKELTFMKNQNIDVSNFENAMEKFKADFGRNARLTIDNFKKAVEEIDKSIKNMEKVKESLLKSAENLRIANGKAEDLTIKRLTRGNPTMKKLFEEAKKEKSE